jgi:mycothiol synthase
MTASPRRWCPSMTGYTDSLSFASPTHVPDALETLIRRSGQSDGQSPFSDQALVSARAGARRIFTASVPGGVLVAAAILGEGELELVVDPDQRRQGLGALLLSRLLTEFDGTDSRDADPSPPAVWAHGDHPASRILLSRAGLEPIRTLLQLRMPLVASSENAATTAFTIRPFRPGADEEAWIELNARVFASHPEQGRITLADLAAREADAWFDADDFLLAWDDGRLVGYNWLKVESDESLDGALLGEIYVIGVDAAEAGRGLGRSLMLAGLNRLRERGCTVAALYVDADNEGAVRLYRSLGFTDYTIDVQYRRPA